MPQGCVIPNCFGDKKRSVYKVPKNISKRENWVKAIYDVYSNLEVGENFRVCEKHFRKADFTTYIDEEYGEVIHEVAVKRKRLKQGAVPHFTDVLNLGASNVPMKAILMDQDKPRESTSDAITAGKSKQIPSTPDPQDTDNTCRLRNNKKIPYPCNICKLPFGSKRLLLKHRCCICKICNKPWGNANHKNCPKVFSCACGEKFPRKREFAMHQKTHVGIYGHCPTCCKQFTNETDLISHVRKMKFPCIYCSTCFPNIEELSAHSIISKPPNYSCKSCKEIFTDSFTATSHSRSHMAPLRSYSRKPKPVNAQEKQVTTKELINNVVEEEKLNEPCELYKQPESEGSVNKLDGNNDKRKLFAKVKEEPYDQKFNEDSEERLEITEPKLYCVKDEFEVDQEWEPNQKEPDIGSPSKQLPTHEGVKVEAGIRQNKRETNEKGLEEVVSEETSKHLECVKIEPRDEEMREAIERVDVVTRKPSKPFDKVEPKFRDEDIKKEPNERGLELSNFEADLEEPCDERFDDDSGKRLAVTELKLESVKVEFEVDGEMRESNPKGLDIGIPSKQLPTHFEGVKVEADLRENKRKTIEKGLDVVVTEKTKLFQCVKVEPGDEEIRVTIEQVDVVKTKPSEPLVKVEPDFRDKYIKKEPNERGLELFFEADEDIKNIM